jgi:hypothetical protein
MALQADSAGAVSKLRSPLRLILLLGLAMLLSFAPAADAESKQIAATTLFQICIESPTILGQTVDRANSHANYEILKKTQVTLLRSYYVLSAAVRNPKIAALSVFDSVEDPVVWLQENLEIEIEKDSEIVAIRLCGREEQAEELTQIVDAVAKAYRDEVIYEEKQRSLATRDLLARSLQNLNQEIKRKLQEYRDMAEESQGLRSASGHVMQQIDLKRLDRIDAEIIRLESEQQTSSDPEAAAAVSQRVEQLRERQSELERKIGARAESSVELTTRQRELEVLQRIADQMTLALEMMDIEANAPDRIRQLQPAIVGPAK